MTPRVLFVARDAEPPDEPAAPHGSAAHVAATLHALRANADVTVVAGGDRPQAAAAAGRRSRRPPLPQIVRGTRADVALLRRDRAFAARVLEAARNARPDLVYERNEYLSLAGLRAARSLRVPLVLESNGLLQLDMRTVHRSLVEPLGGAIDRRKHRAAAAVVTVSPGLAERLAEVGADPERTVVVPNTVPPERVAAERAVRADRAVVGWVGHLMRWHAEALELLVDAAPAVLAAIPHASFRILGAGPGLEALRARTQRLGLGERFDFRGEVAYDAVPAALADVDVGVIPGVFDYAFPVKLVEMGAAGLPVVAPRSASLDAQVAPGVEYEPFATGDRAALAAALVGVLGDSTRRDELGRALHDAVRARYTWDASDRAVGDLLDVVLRG